ncbi:MAG: tripartite tricarboxylate transporter substrate-binding protein, partial [Comamonas sp.]
MIHTPLTRRTLLAGTAAFALQAHASSSTGNWPARTIRLVVPGPAGSGMDIFGRLLAASAAFALQAQASTAASWPARPIRLVVPGPPGSGMDIFGRLLAVQLQEALRQTVVVDNKPGANSLIGTDNVAKAQADGYTLLLSPSSAIAINPVIQAKMPYDTEKDLLPVAQVGSAGVLLVAHPST